MNCVGKKKSIKFADTVFYLTPKQKNMKRHLFVSLLFVILSTLSCWSQDTIRVLAIGNSFSEDAVEHYLYELGKEQNITFIIGNMYIGGCSLERHWNNTLTNKADYEYRKINSDGTKQLKKKATLLDGITDERWDYISLQQNSGNSGIISTYFPYLTDMLAYVKAHATNPKVKYMFHATWAYESNSPHEDFAKYNKDQVTMYNAIVKSVKEATKKVGIRIVIPSGTAVQNGRNSVIGDHFCRDSYHLSLDLGRYTAACTWFERITGKSVLNSKFAPSTVSATNAEIARKAAHYAIKSPYKVTPIR